MAMIVENPNPEPRKNILNLGNGEFITRPLRWATENPKKFLVAAGGLLVFAALTA